MADPRDPGRASSRRAHRPPRSRGRRFRRRATSRTSSAAGYPPPSHVERRAQQDDAAQERADDREPDHDRPGGRAGPRRAGSPRPARRRGAGTGRWCTAAPSGTRRPRRSARSSAEPRVPSRSAGDDQRCDEPPQPRLEVAGRDRQEGGDGGRDGRDGRDDDERVARLADRVVLGGRVTPTRRCRRRRHAGRGPPRRRWTSGRRRIHVRCRLAYRRVRVSMRRIASSRSISPASSAVTSWRPWMRSAVLEKVQSARARRTSSTTPAANIAAVRAAIRLCGLGGRERRGRPRAVGWRVSADQSRLSAAASECPDSASSSARTTRRRSFGCTAAAAGASTAASVACAPGRPTLVVQALCGVADAVRCLGRERHVGERRPHVEAAPAAHDRDAAAVEDLVDRIVGEVRVLGDGALVARLPHGDEMVRRRARGQPPTAGSSGSGARGRAASRRTRRSRRRPCRPARARRRSCPRRWARRSR